MTAAPTPVTVWANWRSISFLSHEAPFWVTIGAIAFSFWLT